MHGRISHIPPQNVHVTTEWQGDDYVLVIEGEVRQSALFGENLLLTRRITTRLGATSFRAEDCVRNDGFRTTPHMLLYHCNFGYPVVSPYSELIVLRGRGVHSVFDHCPKEHSIHLCISDFRSGPVRDRLIREEHREHRTHALGNGADFGHFRRPIARAALSSGGAKFDQCSTSTPLPK